MGDINDYIIKIICKTNKGKQDSILIYLEGMADDDIKKLLEALYWISHKDDGIIKDEAKLFEEITKMSQYKLPHPLKLKRPGRRLTETDLPRSSYLHSAEEVLARRRLVDRARMAAKDVDAMSPSELVMHRRRLTYGARVSPVLAALMDEIEEAKRSYQT